MALSPLIVRYINDACSRYLSQHDDLTLPSDPADTDVLIICRTQGSAQPSQNFLESCKGLTEPL